MHYDGKMKIASHAPAETMVKLLPLAKKWEAEEELADNEKPQTYTEFDGLDMEILPQLELKRLFNLPPEELVTVTAGINTALATLRCLG